MDWWKQLKDPFERMVIRLLDTMDASSPAVTAARSVTTAGSSPAVVIGPAERVVVGPDRRDGRLVIAPTITPAIAPAQRAAWDDRGWVRRDADDKVIYVGDFQAIDSAGCTCRFPGRIVVKKGQAVPYIANPPADIKRHPKGPCFQLTTAPWFRVHWHKPARNVDDALLYVERVLA